jgi:hypothetical protein
MFATRFDAFRTVPASTTVAASNSGGSGTSVSLTAGSYTLATFCSHFQTRLNAVRTPATWTVTPSYTTGFVTIDCVGETWAIDFTTAEVGTSIGFVGNIASTSDPAIGTKNARGLYLPDCPLNIDGHPANAGKATDLRSTVGPTGTSVSLVGTSMYKRTGIRLSHVSPARTFEASASPGYSSWEQWLDDTQFGAGHSWFTPGSAFQLYWDSAGTASIVGASLNSGAGPTAGWVQHGINSFEPKRVHESALIWFEIAIPTLVSSG